MGLLSPRDSGFPHLSRWHGYVLILTRCFSEPRGASGRGGQRKLLQSASSWLQPPPFSNAGSPRQSTKGQFVSCLWPEMGTLRKWQAVCKAKSSAPEPRGSPERARWSLGSGKWWDYSAFSPQGPPKFSPPGPGEKEQSWYQDESTVPPHALPVPAVREDRLSK